MQYSVPWNLELIFCFATERDPVHVLNHTFMPLQGLFNFVTFVRPSYNRVRKSHPNLNFLRVLQKAIQQEYTGPRGSRRNSGSNLDLGASSHFSTFLASSQKRLSAQFKVFWHLGCFNPVLLRQTIAPAILIKPTRAM